ARGMVAVEERGERLRGRGSQSRAVGEFALELLAEFLGVPAADVLDVADRSGLALVAGPVAQNPIRVGGSVGAFDARAAQCYGGLWHAVPISGFLRWRARGIARARCGGILAEFQFGWRGAGRVRGSASVRRPGSWCRSRRGAGSGWLPPR